MAWALALSPGTGRASELAFGYPQNAWEPRVHGPCVKMSRILRAFVQALHCRFVATNYRRHGDRKNGDASLRAFAPLR